LLRGGIDANAVSLTYQITRTVLDVFHHTARIHVNFSRHWEHFITVHFWNIFL